MILFYHRFIQQRIWWTGPLFYCCRCLWYCLVMGSYNNRDGEDNYIVSLWWRVRLAKSTEQTGKISWRLCDIVLTNSRLRPLCECVHKIVSDRNNNDDNNILWLLSRLQSQELLEQHKGIAHTSVRQLFCSAEVRFFEESCRERHVLLWWTATLMYSISNVFCLHWDDICCGLLQRAHGNFLTARENLRDEQFCDLLPEGMVYRCWPVRNYPFALGLKIESFFCCCCCCCCVITELFVL